MTKKNMLKYLSDLQESVNRINVLVDTVKCQLVEKDLDFMRMSRELKEITLILPDIEEKALSLRQELGVESLKE